MPTTNTFGVGVRHAVTRALATHNLSPVEATFRVESSRATVDARGRVLRAEASVHLTKPLPIGRRAPDELRACVNADGAHPLMVRISTERPFWLDVVPVTWDRWSRRRGGTVPPGVDLASPRVGIDFDEAVDFAAELGKRLPTTEELRAAWGPHRWPWGDQTAPSSGRASPHRWGELPEVGLHPPNPWGVWDLGAWLWQWTAEGCLFGGAPHGRTEVFRHDLHPVALRLAADG